jgi:hypothetical protein
MGVFMGIDELRFKGLRLGSAVKLERFSTENGGFPTARPL